MAIYLTKQAAERIRHFLDRQPDKRAFRLSVKKTGCSGWGYEVGLTDTIDADEHRFEDKGIPIVVPDSVLELVDGTTVDFVQQGINSTFVFDNPNAKGECGCGESFTVKDVSAEA